MYGDTFAHSAPDAAYVTGGKRAPSVSVLVLPPLPALPPLLELPPQAVTVTASAAVAAAKATVLFDSAMPAPSVPARPPVRRLAERR
jgi:hypothetical protein